MNKVYLALLVVVVVGSGAYFYLGMQKSSATDTEMAVPEEKKENEDTKSSKTFEVSAANFSYDVKEIKVKQGDKVKIVFTNKEGFHDWVIDEFSARTKQLAADKSETIEFVANKKGTFEYYCSVGSHRAMGMKGSLVVE